MACNFWCAVCVCVCDSGASVFVFGSVKPLTNICVVSDGISWGWGEDYGAERHGVAGGSGWA